MTHPLCEWLAAVHDHRAGSRIPEKHLRIQAEQVLLERHTASASGTWCRYDGESFPCFEWQVIAAGWSWVPGFRNQWRPARERNVLDMDVLLAELDR